MREVPLAAGGAVEKGYAVDTDELDMAGLFEYPHPGPAPLAGAQPPAAALPAGLVGEVLRSLAAARSSRPARRPNTCRWAANTNPRRCPNAAKSAASASWRFDCTRRRTPTSSPPAMRRSTTPPTAPSKCRARAATRPGWRARCAAASSSGSTGTRSAKRASSSRTKAASSSWGATSSAPAATRPNCASAAPTCTRAAAASPARDRPAALRPGRRRGGRAGLGAARRIEPPLRQALGLDRGDRRLRRTRGLRYIAISLGMRAIL